MKVVKMRCEGGERLGIAWALVWRQLVLCSESEEDLGAMVGGFVDV